MGAQKKENAEASGKTLEKNQSTEPVPQKEEAPQQCGKPDKHWVGVRVEDESGKLVKDVTVHLKLPGGTELDVDMASAVLGADGAYRTDKCHPAGDCEFTFPAVYNLEWWPKGGSGGNATAGQSATVEGGDCVLTVADKLGFREYESVWKRSENDELKKTRPNPNTMTKGDVLKAPDKKDKVEKKAMDKVHTFVVKERKPAKLRLVLQDKDGKGMANRPWELKIPVVDKGTTPASGLVEITPLPLNHMAAMVAITVRDAITAPAKPAAPAVPDPPPYPPPIVPADFKDKMDPPELAAKVVDFDLQLGTLETFSLRAGVLGRLHNLGFGCDVDSDDAHATKAVKAFQRWFQKMNNPTGKWEDAQEEVRKRHDMP